MKRLKKVICLLLLICVTPFTLMACGNNQQDNRQDDQQEAQSLTISLAEAKEIIVKALAIDLGRFDVNCSEDTSSDDGNHFEYTSVGQVEYANSRFQKALLTGSDNLVQYLAGKQIFTKEPCQDLTVTVDDDCDNVLMVNGTTITICLDNLPQTFTDGADPDFIWNNTRVSLFYEDCECIDYNNWTEEQRSDNNHTYQFNCEQNGSYRVEFRRSDNYETLYTKCYEITVKGTLGGYRYDTTQTFISYELYYLQSLFEEASFNECWQENVLKTKTNTGFSLTLEMDVKGSSRYLWLVGSEYFDIAEEFEQFYQIFIDNLSTCPVNWQNAMHITTQLYFNNDENLFGSDTDMTLVSFHYTGDRTNPTITGWEKGDLKMSLQKTSDEITEPDWVAEFKAQQ